jgi:CRP/FNR family transcriptional regulator, cyclic AMP receptor protein
VLQASDAKLDAMANVPLFARLSRSELKRIAKVSDEIDVRRGKVLARQGARAREFFVILDGQADVRRDTRLLPPLGPGDFLGEIGLVTDCPRTATVTALTPMRLIVLTERAFRTVLADHPDIQRKVLEAVAVRLARTAL